MNHGEAIVGDRVRLSEGRQEYRDALGDGTIKKITPTRVVVKWDRGKHPRNHLAKGLEKIQEV